MNQNCMYLNVKFTCGSGLSVYAWVYVFFSTYVVVSISAWRIRIKVLLLFSRPVMSDFLWTHGLQHARPLCPSPSPGVCPSSCSLHWWCRSAISSSDTFCPQPFPASGTFPTSHLFTSDDQNTGPSALASVLPVNIQGLSPLRLTDLISLLSKGLSGVFSSTIAGRHQFFSVLPWLLSSSHNHMWPLGRPWSRLYGPSLAEYVSAFQHTV